MEEEEEEEECISLLIGEMPADAPVMAGAMSFLPKLSRLLDTLLMLSGGAFVEPELEKKKYLGSYQFYQQAVDTKFSKPFTAPLSAFLNKGSTL